MSAHSPEGTPSAPQSSGIYSVADTCPSGLLVIPVTPNRGLRPTPDRCREEFFPNRFQEEETRSVRSQVYEVEDICCFSQGGETPLSAPSPEMLGFRVVRVKKKKNMDIDPQEPFTKPLGLDDRAIDFMGQNCLGCSMDFRLQHLQVNLLFCGPPERLGCLNLCCLRMDG